MQHIIGGCTLSLDLAGIDYSQACAACRRDESSITCLSAAERIENGAVKLNTVITDSRNDGVTLAQVGVFSK